MESITNDEELEYTSEEQAHMGDSPSKDLADSNSLHQEYSQLHDKQSPNGLKSLTTSTSLPEPLIQEPVDSFKSTSDDLLSRSYTEKDLNITANVSEEISEELVKVSTENTNISSVKTSSKSSLGSPEKAVSDLLEETGSTKETVSVLPGETGSTEVIVSDLQGETGSTEAIVSDLQGETGSTEETVSDHPEEGRLTEETMSDHPEEGRLTEETVSALPEESGSSKETVSALPEESGSTKETASALPEESGSTKETVSTISQENAPIEVHQPVLSEETKSTELFQLSDSEEPRLNEAITSRFDLWMSGRIRTILTSLPDTKLAQIAPNDINRSALSEICSERYSGTAIHFSSSEDPSDSSRIVSKDTGISTFQGDCEKLVKEFDFDRWGCGSRVQKPPISLSTRNSSIEVPQPICPANYSAVPKAISSETSLSTLLSTLAQWVSRGLKNTSSFKSEVNFSDLKDYAEKETIYGLYVLIKLNKRVDALLKAADGLPYPAPIFLCRLGGQRSLIRDGLNDAGIKVRRRLEALEVETTEDFDKFLSVCHNSKLNCDESDIKEIKDAAFSLITNSFLNASENVLVLGSEIQNFRSKIREFCSEIDKLL